MHADAYPKQRAAAALAITAGAGQDGQAQTGVIIDRANTKYSKGVALCFGYSATLAQTKTLTFKSMKVEHSDNSDLSSPADLQVLEDSTGTVIATGATGGSTEAGVKQYFVHLGTAKRYIRLTYTPDLNATGTDTASIYCLGVFDTPYQLP